MKFFIKKIFFSLGLQLLNIKRYEEIIKTKKTYSQIGEDIIVQYIFSLKGIKAPSYLDIGSNHPISMNNTYLFYIKGSRGINIDANPDCTKEFIKHRPGDLNLNIGIGPFKGESEFYVMEDSALSTFSRKELEDYVSLGYKLKSILKMPLLTIDEVLRMHNSGNMPDFLSVDAEGMDFEIIKQIDFINSRPKVICVEASEHSITGIGKIRQDLLDYILAKEYFLYGSTYLNAIFVDQNWFF